MKKERALMPGVMRVLAAVTVGLGVMAYAQGGWGLWFQGLANASRALYGAAGLLVLAFAISGLMEVLVPPSAIRKWLGGQSGMRGVMLGGAAGALTPGGPYVYYPICMNLYRNGAGTGTIMAYLAGKGVWDLSRLPLEIGFFGTSFAAIRLAVTALVPLAAGLLGNYLFGDRPGEDAGGGMS
jgi:uncharacterized membrane protein YraQ (UPF0718 family)